MLRPPLSGDNVRLRLDPSGAAHANRAVIGFERLPGDEQAVAFDRCAQIIFLEVGFLHQPIGEPAQQLRLGTAALETARPEPHLVGEELRHPSLADAIEDEQRVAVIAAHHRHAVMDACLDLAEPAAPSRFAARCAGPGEILRHRVAATQIGDPRLEALFEDIPGGLGRQYRSERGAVEAQRRAEARPGRFEEGAAVADVARDIFEIGLRDHARAGCSDRR